jgi:hypothetical protein
VIGPVVFAPGAQTCATELKKWSIVITLTEKDVNFLSIGFTRHLWYFGIGIIQIMTAGNEISLSNNLDKIGCVYSTDAAMNPRHDFVKQICVI